jgi:hypothetical protein
MTIGPTARQKQAKKRTHITHRHVKPTGGLNYVEQKDAQMKRNLYWIPIAWIGTAMIYGESIK